MATKSICEVIEEAIPGSSVNESEWEDLLGALRSSGTLRFPPCIDRTKLADLLEQRLVESVGKYIIEVPRDTPMGPVEDTVGRYFTQFGFSSEFAHGNGKDEFFQIYRRGPYAISAFVTMSSHHGIQSILLTLEEYEGQAIPASC